jgi:hypothetical protein
MALCIMDASQAATAGGGLLRLDIGRTNDFTPFLRFIGDELAEIGR